MALLRSALLCAAMLWPWSGAVAAEASRAGAEAKASVRPVDLRCEYLTDPLGIDVRTPRLSWKLAATDAGQRGQKQSGYHVLVAGTEAALSQGKGDLWDSGDVASDRSVLVPYAGRALESGRECWWKVQVRDEAGHVSAWSRPAHWSMGLLQPNDWSAQWIGTGESFEREQGNPPPDNTMPDPWFRKVVELPEVPKRAVAYVASIGYHELYVNGKKVGDAVLSPAVTDNTQRARYLTYDVTKYLQPGKNVLGLWLGVSWSIFPKFVTPDKPQAPLVMAQAEFAFENGKNMRVVTDDSWRTHPSPNTLLGVWDFMNFGGEIYDAGKEMADWNEVSCDDSQWAQAKVFHPSVKVTAQQVEEDRRVQAVRPVSVKEIKPGVCRVDMGVNYAGWFQIRLKGEPGDRVELKFSEREEQPMTHRLHSVYVIGPSGEGTFCNRFNYAVGRWVEISGLRGKPSLDDMRGWLIRTDYKRAGQFECSNPLLNRIYETALWTWENLSLGGYSVDCPQRERMGYGGDAHATTETALGNFDLGAFYTKWSQDWRDVQGADGNLPYTAPTYWGGGGPGWSGYCVTLPWEVYEQYGDRRILEENFKTIQHWLAFLETKATDNLLRRWGGEWDFLGDWLWPGAKGVNGDTRETLFFNNCYWIYNLQTAARIADVLGAKEAAAAWRKRAKTVRAAVHQEFFRPGEASYVNGFQAYLSIALLTHVMPESLRGAVWQRLEDEIQVQRHGHFFAGITGGYFVIENLLNADRPDLVYEMATKEDYPGWGDMLKQGATTFWEDWEGRLSRLHSSYLHIGAWFLEGLAGIRPDPERPGYQHFLIRPGIVPGKLDWVKGSYDSIYGSIRSDWKMAEGNFDLHATVPPNTSATVYLPVNDGQSVTEQGKPLTGVDGVDEIRSEDTWMALELRAGTYDFRVR